MLNCKLKRNRSKASCRKRLRKVPFRSAYVNAPTKRKAEGKVRYWQKRIHGAKKVVITSHYGGETGDKYGKNYWFNGYMLIPIRRRK